jgi:hypothetical protein
MRGSQAPANAHVMAYVCQQCSIGIPNPNVRINHFGKRYLKPCLVISSQRKYDHEKPGRNEVSYTAWSTHERQRGREHPDVHSGKKPTEKREKGYRPYHSDHPTILSKGARVTCFPPSLPLRLIPNSFISRWSLPLCTMSDWSFGFRSTNCFYDSDSDNNSDSDSHQATSDTLVNTSGNDRDQFKESEEAKGIRDLDLSCRDEEGVVYKPNPFSIAKINAAVRAVRRGKSGDEKAEAQEAGNIQNGTGKEKENDGRKKNVTLFCQPGGKATNMKGRDPPAQVSTQQTLKFPRVRAPAPVQGNKKVSKPTLASPKTATHRFSSPPTSTATAKIPAKARDENAIKPLIPNRSSPSPITQSIFSTVEPALATSSDTRFPALANPFVPKFPNAALKLPLDAPLKTASLLRGQDAIDQPQLHSSPVVPAGPPVLGLSGDNTFPSTRNRLGAFNPRGSFSSPLPSSRMITDNAIARQPPRPSLFTPKRTQANVFPSPRVLVPPPPYAPLTEVPEDVLEYQPPISTMYNSRFKYAPAMAPGLSLCHTPP